MKSNPLIRFTKLFLDFMFYTGILVTLSVPVLFRLIDDYYPAFKTYYIPMCILFIGCGICALWIIFDLRSIFRTVLEGDCFVKRNVTSLKRMGVISFIISLLSVIRCCFVITAATLSIILVFFIAGLFSLVLAQVFEQAVSYKQENDFTI